MMTPLVKKTIGFAPNGAVNLAKRFRPSGYFPIASTRGAENNRSRRFGKKRSQPHAHGLPGRADAAFILGKVSLSTHLHNLFIDLI